MIRNAKIYTKKNRTNKQKRTDRTLGQMVKAKLYKQNHTMKHMHTYSQQEKKEKIIYAIASKVHCLNFGTIFCLFRYSTDVAYITLIVEI